jgi:hypothetical protein
MPQTVHNHGKTKASSASVRPLNQPATVLRAEAGGENRSKDRMQPGAFLGTEKTLKTVFAARCRSWSPCSAYATLPGEKVGLKLFPKLVSGTSE